MTIEQMREFVILAEERNFMVAADMLYTTQATLSRHVMAMEKELGFLLFTRTTKKIELTRDGGRFLVYARRAMKLQDDYIAELECAKRSMSETLTVGYNALVSFYNFTDTLTQFMTANQKIPIKMLEDDSEVLAKAILNGSCDIAFVQENPFSPIEELEKIYVATDTLDAVLPHNHPLARCDDIELTQLKDEDFAMGIENRIPGKIFLEACRRAGFEPRVVQNGLVCPALFTWIGTNKNCVSLEWHTPAQRHKNDRTAIVPVKPTLKAHTAIIYRANRLSASGKKLIEHFTSRSGLTKGTAV